MNGPPALWHLHTSRIRILLYLLQVSLQKIRLGGVYKLRLQSREGTEYFLQRNLSFVYKIQLFIEKNPNNLNYCIVTDINPNYFNTYLTLDSTPDLIQNFFIVLAYVYRGQWKQLKIERKFISSMYSNPLRYTMFGSRKNYFSYLQ